MNISLDTAHRLFQEAADFSSGRQQFISQDSEIRGIAMTIYGRASTTHLQRVCDQIFYAIACEHMAETLTDHRT